MLISLDGAGAADLWSRYEQGELDDRRGFRRFFDEGVVAEALVPASPTLTSTNHATLATGAPPGRTGIVSNTIHLPGTPLGKTVRGFDLPIEVETLWEAARRQGKRAVSVTWPSVEAGGEDRWADAGMFFVNDPEHPARVVELGAEAWREPDGSGPTGSYSPVRFVRLTVEGGGDARLAYRLYAVDRTDDGQVGYDAVAIRPDTESARMIELRAGEWGEVVDDPVRRAGEGPAVRGLKLLAIAPDLRRVRLYLGGSFRLRAYPEAYLLDLLRAGLYWPGAPDDDHLDAAWTGEPGIDLATFVEQSGRFAAFYGAAVGRLAADPSWDLALVYLPNLDEAGHELSLVSPRQPGHSAPRVAELSIARRAVWELMDRFLADLLDDEAMAGTAVVVVSDHGMAPVHSSFDPNVLLRREGLLATDAEGRIAAEGTTAWAANSSASAHVYLRDDLPAAARRPLVARLERLFEGFAVGGERPVARAAAGDELAALGLDHRHSGDLVLFAAPGWSVGFSHLASGELVRQVPVGSYGTHGYLAERPEMEAIYLAIGPGVGRGRTGKVRGTEVAGRVAGLLGIELGDR